MKQMLQALLANGGVGDFNDYSVDVMTEALKAKTVKLFASGKPNINMKLTRYGKELAR